eukprot:m.90951 g.90951  ORF g.90951 m.90951 type:complete len:260 (+) comp18192_c6_seq1:1035-1814(+)
MHTLEEDRSGRTGGTKPLPPCLCNRSCEGEPAWTWAKGSARRSALSCAGIARAGTATAAVEAAVGARVEAGVGKTAAAAAAELQERATGARGAGGCDVVATRAFPSPPHAFFITVAAGGGGGGAGEDDDDNDVFSTTTHTGVKSILQKKSKNKAGPRISWSDHTTGRRESLTDVAPTTFYTLSDEETVSDSEDEDDENSSSTDGGLSLKPHPSLQSKKEEPKKEEPKKEEPARAKDAVYEEKEGETFTSMNDSAATLLW